MRRRDFIAGVASTAAWPVAARPVDVALDQLARRQLAGLEGCVDVVGRC
jgi:hypothetical protein